MGFSTVNSSDFIFWLRVQWLVYGMGVLLRTCRWSLENIGEARQWTRLKLNFSLGSWGKIGISAIERW